MYLLLLLYQTSYIINETSYSNPHRANVMARHGVALALALVFRSCPVRAYNYLLYIQV